MVGLAILLPKKAHPLGKFVSLAIPELHTFIENDIMLSKEFEICGGLECTINTVKSCYKTRSPYIITCTKQPILIFSHRLELKNSDIHCYEKPLFPILWKK